MSNIDGQQDYRREARLSRPGLAKKMDHKGSPTSAIRLWCITQCQGGSAAAAKACVNFGCFFYPYGLAEAPRPDGSVPSEEEYDALGPSQEQREAARVRFVERLGRGKGQEPDEDDAETCQTEPEREV